MTSLPRVALLAAAVLGIAGALTLGDPSPPAAQANIGCEIGVAPSAAITGAIGIGNPAADACNAITDPALGVAEKALNPIKGIASSIGNGVFNQITSWVTDGASWLMGQVVSAIDATTSPNLMSKGFVHQYRQMALIAVFLATLMLLFAVLEGLGRGDSSMLVRVFLVNLPLAAVATSVAYVVVQTLIATTDVLSHQVALSTAQNTRHFFEGAIHGLSEAGGAAGAASGTATGGPGVGTATGAAAGSVAVPLFVSFIAAAIAAVAAFCVWVELLMRDAAVYVVALFMPMALAASIWPRWSSALRRTAELIVVIIFSKFVIVAIISLAAGLLAENGGQVEHVLAAGALMLLACFAPFVLFKLVPFAEGAVSSAYHRQGAAGGAMRGAHMASSSAQMMRSTAQANWGGAAGAKASSGGSGASASGASSGAAAGFARGGGAKNGSASSAGKAGSAGKAAGAAGGAEAGAAGAGAAAAPAAAIAAPVAAAKASKAAGQRLAGTATGQASSAGSAAPSSESASSAPRDVGSSAAPRPSQSESAPQGSSAAPQPSEAAGGKAPGGDTQPPRPAPEPTTTPKSNAGSKR